MPSNIEPQTPAHGISYRVEVRTFVFIGLRCFDESGEADFSLELMLITVKTVRFVASP